MNEKSLEKHPKLDALELTLEKISGYWNGEDDKYVGGDGEIYTEESAQCADEAIEKIEELKLLLDELDLTY